MTPMSLLPKIARQAGVAFEQLVEQILSAACLDPVEVSAAEDVAAPAERLAG